MCEQTAGFWGARDLASGGKFTHGESDKEPDREPSSGRQGSPGGARARSLPAPRGPRPEAADSHLIVGWPCLRGKTQLYFFSRLQMHRDEGEDGCL